MKEHYCKYCGKDTIGVDYDYLIGSDHLACVLSDMPELKDWAKGNNKKQKPMEIKNWTKLNGQKFDVMGVTMRMQNAEVDNEIDRYTVWLIDTEVTTEPLMRVDMYLADKEIDIKTFIPDTFGSPPHHTRKKITKDHIKDPSIFIQTIGMMMMGDPNVRKVLDYLDEIGGNVGARGGMSGGIISQTMNAGTSVTYNSGGASSGFNGSSGNKLW